MTVERAHPPLQGAAFLEHLKQVLDQAGAGYEILTHLSILMSAEDGVRHGMGSLAEMAPTLVLETEKGYLAAVISGETRLSYKKIKKALGLKNISLASPEVVLRETGAPVGCVSLVNPGLPTLIDLHVTQFPAVFGGCGIPNHTLRIKPADLIAVTRAEVFDFTVPKDPGEHPLP